MKEMGHNKIVILVTTGLLLLSGIFFYTIHEDAEEYRAGVSEDILVEQTWELPGELNEVSGIAFLEPNRVACVQDEKGIIFIYDLESSSIVKEVEFAGSGDYEGIAVDGSTAYVLAAKGQIFRVNNFMEQATVDTFDTPFSLKNDMESLFLDTSENRLLLLPKERGLESEETKGVYAVDLNTMEVAKPPLFSLTFEEEIFQELKGKDGDSSFYPSEIGQDPNSGKYLILEARKPHLLIINRNGEPEDLHRLDPNIFPQPEGITFDNAGDLYISNEGSPATIHKVTIKNR